MNEIEVNSNPRRAQGGMGLLSRSIHVQSLHKSMAKILTPREEKGGTGRRRGERQKEGVLRLAHREKREREKVAVNLS